MFRHLAREPSGPQNNALIETVKPFKRAKELPTARALLQGMSSSAGGSPKASAFAAGKIRLGEDYEQY
jgi:hypothetical protein